MANENEAGCWFDSSRGIHIGTVVQQLAIEEGWMGPMEKVDSEFFSEATDEAEQWLNDQCAPEGFLFGMSDQGDWGLWPIGDEEDW